MGEEIGGFPGYSPEKWHLNDGSYVDHFGDLVFNDAVQGVIYLQAWAKSAGKDAIRSVNPCGKRNTGDKALRFIFRSIVDAWSDILNKQSRMSVGAPGRNNQGQPTGPMLVFVRACLKPLGLELSDEAIRWRVRSALGMGKLDLEEI